jgi:hypothetical protein
MELLNISINNDINSGVEMENRKIPKPGEKYNRLTIISYHHSDKRWRKHYLCLCDCGTEKVIQGTLITSGNTKSCGCLAKETKSTLHRLPNDGGVINHLILQYKRHARDKGLEYELSYEQFEKLIRGPCSYCGIPPSNNKITKNCKGFLYSGIDRVDSTLGYIPDNCVSACSDCNRVKCDMTKEEFYAWVKRLCAMAEQWGNTSSRQANHEQHHNSTKTKGENRGTGSRYPATEKGRGVSSDD